MKSAAEYLAQGDGEWIQLTCAHCGKASGWTRWTNRPISGELPAGEFQCPKCGHAFKRQRRPEGDHWVTINGRLEYRTIDLVPIASRL